MANKVEDPKKLAAKIAKTKALAGGREVTVNATPSPGMPGSGKSATLSGVVITDKANKPMSAVIARTKPAEESKYQVGRYVYIKYPKSTGGSQVIKYPKVELLKAFKKEGLKLNLGGMDLISPDDYHFVKKIADRNKVPVYDETYRTRAQADSIFATGKSN